VSASQTVRLDHDGDLAVVTFDSPPVNLFDARMAEGLGAVLTELEAGRPHAVLFRAEGKLFSGGVDVNVFAGLRDSRDAIPFWEELIQLPRRTELLPCPTVFAAHGLCLTWAFELALACDLIVASERARFGLVERVVGLTPALGGTQRLCERAGAGRARELVMTGGLFDAATLERWNVVNRILPADGFDQSARAFTGDLAAGPPLAHTATKQIVRACLEGGVGLADSRTPAIAGGLFDTEDLQGAVRSFLDEGPGRATFAGR
jgi:enoyl-CoA hydratase/carnithine racemase